MANNENVRLIKKTVSKGGRVRYNVTYGPAPKVKPVKVSKSVVVDAD